MKKPSLLFKNGLILLHILFAIVGFYTYLSAYKLAETLLIQRTLSKQLVLAKAGSLAVENLLKNVQSELTSFIFSFDKSRDTDSIDIDSTRAEFVNYMQRSELPVSGIALFDEKGTVSILENRQHLRDGEGEDFSKAQFIKWSQDPKNKGKVYISTPLIGTVGSSKGKIIYNVAEPLYFGNKFKGTLAIRLRVEDFTKAFVSPLYSDSSEDVFVVNTSGVVIAGKDSLLNKNLFDYAKSEKWPNYQDYINKLALALKKNETQTTWTSKLPNEAPREMLVGISKIDVPGTDQDLYLKVATPKEAILTSLAGLRKYGYFWLGFGVLTTIVGSIIIIRLRAD